MSRRTALISEWRNRLADCQAEIASAEHDGQPRIRGWVQRAYARVLRFLLAQYGRKDANDSSRALKNPNGPNVAVTANNAVIFDVPLSGAPPKDATRIRAALEKVHSQIPEPVAGPNVGGLGTDDYVSIASFRSESFAMTVRQHLRQLGIPARIDWSDKEKRIEVPCGDRERVHAALEAYNLDAQDRSAASMDKEAWRNPAFPRWIQWAVLIVMCFAYSLLLLWIAMEVIGR